METLSQAITRLRAAGYVTDFSASPEGNLLCRSCGARHAPESIEIRETVRFEGDSNPDDEAILLAVSCADGCLGTYSVAFGAGAPPADVTFLQRLSRSQTGPAQHLSGTGADGGLVFDAWRPNRSARAAAEGQGPEVVMLPGAPYRLDLTVWALRRRSRNRLDQWDGTYRRALVVGDRPVSVEVKQNGGVHPMLTLSVLTPGRYTTSELDSIKGQVQRLLGATVSLESFYGLAEIEPRLGELVHRFVGVRPPRFPTLFEAMVNAIANQQLSLEVGIELLNRFTDQFGTRPKDAHGLVAFPDAESILTIHPDELRGLGFSMRKAEYILSSAHAVATGAITSSQLESCDRIEATELLLAIRGLGRWSAEYILLRGVGRLDVFPADDVGARNKIQRLMELTRPPNRGEIISMTAPWDPWAGMVYFHLLLDGLAQSGFIDD